MGDSDSNLEEAALGTSFARLSPPAFFRARLQRLSRHLRAFELTGPGSSYPTLGFAVVYNKDSVQALLMCMRAQLVWVLL